EFGLTSAPAPSKRPAAEVEMDLDLALGAVDRRRNGGAQLTGGNGNAGAHDGQDQRILGRRGARLITNERQNDVFHSETLPCFCPPLRKRHANRTNRENPW